MMKLIASICLACFAGLSGDRMQKYHAVEAYEIRPGIIATPIYTAGYDLCEISIEKRHYSNNNIDIDAKMSKEQILTLFDELVPKEDRGQPGWKFRGDTVITEADSGILTMRIPYENVTLAMYGIKDSPDRQKYVAAIISWNNLSCDGK